METPLPVKLDAGALKNLMATNFKLIKALVNLPFPTFHLCRCSLKLGETEMFENNFIPSHNSYPVSWV